MKDAVKILKQGGVIVYPTDTAYGLGCDSTNETAVKKIFKIKGREQSKTMPLIAGDIGMVEKWASLAGKARELAQKHWPGPLTLILPIKKKVLAQSVIKDKYIAVRVPSSKIAQKLSQELGVPIVSTSANKAGGNNCYSVEAIKKSLGESFKLIDYTLDTGELPQAEVSTIAKVWNNKATVIRKGVIAL